MICRPPAVACALTVVALTVVACETSVDPFESDMDRRFAVHGYLDTAADTQVVRVQALRLAAEMEEDRLDGVTVRLEPAGTPWEPFTATDAAGDPVHGFRAGFEPQAGHRYELVVEQDGVQRARAETAVPPIPGVETAQATGDAVALRKDVTLTGLGSLEGTMVVWYEVEHPVTGLRVRLEMDYVLPRPSAGPNRRFTVYLTQDRAEILRRLGRSPADWSVKLLRTGANVILRSMEWQSTDVDPGLLDGHGFFASVGRYDVTWRIPASEVLTMGMVDAQ